MPYQMWSWLLTAVGVTGLWIVPRRWWGWAINLAGQGLWLAYALVTGQYGFLVATFAYGFVFGRNLWRAWQARPKPFEVTSASFYGTAGGTYGDGSVVTAEGFVNADRPEARIGYEFEYEGRRMTIVRLFYCETGATRLRFEADDTASIIARNTRPDPLAKDA